MGFSFPNAFQSCMYVFSAVDTSSNCERRYLSSFNRAAALPEPLALPVSLNVDGSRGWLLTALM